MANARVNRRTMLRSIIVFILLPLLAELLMYGQMRRELVTWAGARVDAQARILRDLASQRLTNRMEELERVTGYFRDGVVDYDDMGDTASKLLSSPDRRSLGIVRLGGEAVSGVDMLPTEYPAVMNAFRGRTTVRYRPDEEGLIFTAPIMNGPNVKYVLYEIFPVDSVLESFGANSFDGQGIFILADSSVEFDLQTFGEDNVSEATIASVRDNVAAMMREGFGVEYRTDLGKPCFIFVAELEQSDLFLVGRAPFDTMAGGLKALFNSIVVIFFLLVALLGIGVFRIVTVDAKARESDELRLAKKSAEDAYMSKSRFLANMSHELRTPINSILGMDEMILRESVDPETRDRAMDIRSATQILLALINDVLDFSKIESGMLTIIPGEYSTVNLIRDLTLLSENRARSKSLEFRLNISPQLPATLFGDDLRLQQILTNLLTNAIKYTSEGYVSLSISGEGSGNDFVLCCSVSDTGSGIRKEDMEKLMQLTPFTRVDEDRNRKVEGSGLGIPIILNLLKLMGSSLKVDSIYGEGSTFSFELRQRVVDSAPIGDIRERLKNGAAEFEYRATVYAPGAHVLVVDDNALNRKIFRDLVKATGVQVTAASGGMRCLELTRTRRYDVIFMDHLMPDLDGVETLHRIREEKDNLCAEVPVVALTANAFSGAQEAYSAMGFDAFLSKPIATDKLEALMKELIPEELQQTPPEGAVAAPEHHLDRDSLPNIPGVNWDYALLNIREPAIVLEALSDFYYRIPDEIEVLTEEEKVIDVGEGLNNYRRSVHTLKSTAAVVGILTVSELARMSEAAAMEDDVRRVRTLHPILLDQLKRTHEQLTPSMEQLAPKGEEISPEELTALLETLRASLEDYDVTASDAVIARLTACRPEGVLGETVNSLRAAVRDMEYDKALGLLRVILPEEEPSEDEGGDTFL